MKITMRTNLGSVHAAEIGVEFSECTAGKTVDVSERAATWLIEHGKAVLAEQKGVPATSEQKGK